MPGNSSNCFFSILNPSIFVAISLFCPSQGHLALADTCFLTICFIVVIFVMTIRFIMVMMMVVVMGILFLCTVKMRLVVVDSQLVRNVLDFIQCHVFEGGYQVGQMRRNPFRSLPFCSKVIREVFAIISKKWQ